MRYIKPYYFDNFKCAADKCPDTCCAGWQIVIDDTALENYMQVTGEFAGRLTNGIDWQEGSFRQCNGRCTMLNENNLCDLVTALGEESLCETCDRYPRHEEEFEGLREWSLSLSCPIAAHMILECEEPVRFLVEEDEEEDPLEDEFEDFDLLLFTQLEDARKVLFQIALDSSMPMEQRFEQILEMAEQMQSCLDEDRLFDMDELIAGYAGKSGDRRPECECGGSEKRTVDEEHRFHELQKHFRVLQELERLREEWTQVLDAMQNMLDIDFASYKDIRQGFLAEYGRNDKYREQWERFQENILIFFLYTYFCGAVYDDWIYSKAALSVFSVMFIGEFVMCKWNLADKYINWEECVELAYRYAREVEHSDDNLNLLEEWLQENPLTLKGTEH